MLQPIQQAITGKEDQGDLSTPHQLLVQFYYAFNNGELATMAENWEQSAASSMDNPLGGIKRGWPEIRAVYERIFNGPAEVYVEYHDYTIHESADVFYVVGRERGYFRTGDMKLKLAIRTTRIFRRVQGSWKQAHHHGSIDNPELLKRYQAAVRLQ